jgi:hypothetical protein
MNQNNQPQDIVEQEKSETGSTDRPARDSNVTDNRTKREERSGVGADKEGSPQPMAHPPEDTFVAEDTQSRPGRKND